MDTQYGIFFFHDFSKYKTLKSQIESIKSKYQRRIDRFLNNIEKPTLFIRYISNEIKNVNGKSVELQYIEENNDYINKVLKMYNDKNDIIYIGDEKIQSNIIKVYNVSTEDDSNVSPNPIINNAELYNIIKKIKIPGQQENIRKYRKTLRKKRSLYIRFKRKVKSAYYRKFCNIYIHSKEYNIPNK